MKLFYLKNNKWYIFVCYFIVRILPDKTVPLCNTSSIFWTIILCTS